MGRSKVFSVTTEKLLNTGKDESYGEKECRLKCNEETNCMRKSSENERKRGKGSKSPKGVGI